MRGPFGSPGMHHGGGFGNWGHSPASSHGYSLTPVQVCTMGPVLGSRDTAQQARCAFRIPRLGYSSAYREKGNRMASISFCGSGYCGDRETSREFSPANNGPFLNLTTCAEPDRPRACAPAGALAAARNAERPRRLPVLGAAGPFGCDARSAEVAGVPAVCPPSAGVWGCGAGSRTGSPSPLLPRGGGGPAPDDGRCVGGRHPPLGPSRGAEAPGRGVLLNEPAADVALPEQMSHSRLVAPGSRTRRRRRVRQESGSCVGGGECGER